jgi:hypothetical protein
MNANQISAKRTGREQSGSGNGSGLRVRYTTSLPEGKSKPWGLGNDDDVCTSSAARAVRTAKSAT